MELRLLKGILFVLFLFADCFCVVGQVSGEWTWVSGSNQLNFPGNYGTKGVAASTNNPPGVYEACEWVDKSGNFWFYGGLGVNGMCSDLWKYDVSINQWTWVNGPGIPITAPHYGIKGVAASSNSPGFRSTSYSWTDTSGNFWLYGGISYYNGGGLPYGDLWKYDVSTDMWSWMKGDSGSAAYGKYVSKGLEDSMARPPALEEMGISWTDNNNNLWLLDTKGCMWKYRIQTNNWTWMKGDTSGSYPAAVYGTKGLESNASTPGHTFFDYTRWKDSKGDFWYLYSAGAAYLRVLWKYSVSTNNWTWMWGDTITSNAYNYGIKCTLNDSTINPRPRLETRACWIDSFDNLWLLGGGSAHASTNLALNDLIYYDTKHARWVWVDNSINQITASTYGTQGVPSSTNMPCSRMGALPYKNDENRLWLFGGMNYHSDQTLGDLWMYTIDASCVNQNLNDINYNADEANFSIFPNPSNGYFNVSSITGIQKIIIRNLLGIKVCEYYSNEINNTLQVNQPGIYYVSVVIEGRTSTRKLIIH